MYYRKEQLLRRLKAFVTAYTYAEARRILEAHPELLSDEADMMLGDLIQFTRRQGDKRVVPLFEERRALLRRCREVGIDQAFAEIERRVSSLLEVVKSFTTARTWDEARRIVESHPELLTDEADALLEALIEAARTQGNAGAVRGLEEHRALLRRCREVGITQAFAEREKRVGSLAEALKAFIMAPTLSEARRILKAHPELLSDEADAILDKLIRFAETHGEALLAPRLVRRYEKRRALLHRCRAVGVEQAFAEIDENDWLF